MALVHESLYQSKNFSSIDFENYLNKLVPDLCKSQSVKENAVCYRINCNGISLGLDRAIPCRLIFTELITNAFKHAFPGGQRWYDNRGTEN